MLPFTRKIYCHQIYKESKTVPPGAEGGYRESLCHGDSIAVWGVLIFWRWMVQMVV